MKDYWSGLWTEDTLRMHFILRLKENLKIKKIRAETEYPFRTKVYKPDLVVDVVKDDGEIETVAFEMKFFSDYSKCKEDLDKLKNYKLFGWDRGYFLAILTPLVCQRLKDSIEKIRAELDQEDGYELKVLVSAQELNRWCYNIFMKELVKKLFPDESSPILLNELINSIEVYFESYILVFFIDEGHLITAAVTDPSSINAFNAEGYSLFDIEEGSIKISDSGGFILVQSTPLEGAENLDELASMMGGQIKKFRESVKS
ncbi:MAG: hypothetical protein QXQ53_04700 [Candidatus Methanosuratincola sp.]